MGQFASGFRAWVRAMNLPSSIERDQKVKEAFERLTAAHRRGFFRRPICLTRSTDSQASGSIFLIRDNSKARSCRAGNEDYRDSPLRRKGAGRARALSRRAPPLHRTWPDPRRAAKRECKDCRLRVHTEHDSDEAARPRTAPSAGRARQSLASAGRSMTRARTS